MPELVALDLPAGQRFVDELTRVWAAGDAAFPVDQRLPRPQREQLIRHMAASAVITADDRVAVTGGRRVDHGDALVVATSGSTGVPKGVVLTHDAVRASAVATSARLGVTDDDHWLACLPLAHVGGLSVVCRALLTGTRLTVHESFDARRVDATDATLVSLVATALQRIDASRFRTIVLGGAQPPTVRPPNVVTTYGMTETGSGVVYDGVPLEGVDVRIVAGEIQLRGAMLLRRYRDETVPFTDDGWFPTGDLGQWDGETLDVHGRQGDLIITGGENVWPDPVEATIGQLAAVADVAVIGVADETWGQAVTAVVVPADPGSPPSLDEIRGHVKATMPPFCAPTRVVFVERLPRTALGKLQRSAVRDSLSE